MRSRTFLNVSLGILALALAYHCGARTATAQAGSAVATFSVAGTQGQYHYLMTPNGDVYLHIISGPAGAYSSSPPIYLGNYWGGATPTEQSSFGSLKARYRGPVEPQGVKPSTNR
jgi:hypothetical protein